MTPRFSGSSIFTDILAISPILFLMLNQFIWKTSITTVATLLPDLIVGEVSPTGFGEHHLCTKPKSREGFPFHSPRLPVQTSKSDFFMKILQWCWYTGDEHHNLLPVYFCIFAVDHMIAPSLTLSTLSWSFPMIVAFRQLNYRVTLLCSQCL